MKETRGDLSKTGLPKLLHLIYREGAPASVLDISRDPVKKRFYFKDGVPVFATSNVLNEVLGRLLMQEGVISRQDYESSLEVVLKEKRRHGEVLISQGLITAGQLDSFLTLQLKRRLWNIFGWTEGSWKYGSIQSLPQTISPHPLHPARLILDGISLGFYPLSRIRADLKEHLEETAALCADGNPYSLEDFGLTIQERRFLESFDGSRTFRNVLETTDLLRQRALSLAATFILTGIVKGAATKEEPETVAELEIIEEARPHERPAGAQMDSRLNAELLFMRAKTAIDKNDWAAAVKTLREITGINPLEGEYRAYLGWALFNSGEAAAQQAEKAVKDAIDLDNDLDIAWHFLGMLYLAQGAEDEAARAFRAAQSKNPWMLDSVAELKRLELKSFLPEPRDIAARASYVEFYGFSEDPFTPVPDAKYASPGNQQAEALGFLTAGITGREGTMLLTAPDGMGKTTLALELLKNLSGKKILCALVLRPPARELELLREVNSEIGNPADASAIKEQLLSLGMKVSRNKTQGGHTVVVIDNAHTLSRACLKLVQYLSRLKSVQIVLLSTPELEATLNEAEFSELNGNIKSRFALTGPLTKEEVRSCVTKRLSLAAKKEGRAYPAVSFTSADIDEVYEASKGVPSLVNEKAAAVLARSIKSHEKEEVSFETFTVEEEPSKKETPKDEISFDFLDEEPGVEAAQQASAFEKPAPVTEDNGAGGAKEARHAPTPKHEKHYDAAPASIEKPEVAPKGAEGKRNIKTLIIWVVVMLIAGLAAGSVIGLIWFGRAGKAPEVTAPPVVVPSTTTNMPAPGTDKTKTPGQGAAPAR